MEDEEETAVRGGFGQGYPEHGSHRSGSNVGPTKADGGSLTLECAPEEEYESGFFDSSCSVVEQDELEQSFNELQSEVEEINRSLEVFKSGGEGEESLEEEGAAPTLNLPASTCRTVRTPASPWNSPILSPKDVEASHHEEVYFQLDARQCKRHGKLVVAREQHRNNGGAAFRSNAKAKARKAKKEKKRRTRRQGQQHIQSYDQVRPDTVSATTPLDTVKELVTLLKSVRVSSGRESPVRRGRSSNSLKTVKSFDSFGEGNLVLAYSRRDDTVRCNWEIVKSCRQKLDEAEEIVKGFHRELVDAEARLHQSQLALHHFYDSHQLFMDLNAHRILPLTRAAAGHHQDGRRWFVVNRPQVETVESWFEQRRQRRVKELKQSLLQKETWCREEKVRLAAEKIENALQKVDLTLRLFDTHAAALKACNVNGDIIKRWDVLQHWANEYYMIREARKCFTACKRRHFPSTSPILTFHNLQKLVGLDQHATKRMNLSYCDFPLCYVMELLHRCSTPLVRYVNSSPNYSEYRLPSLRGEYMALVEESVVALVKLLRVNDHCWEEIKKTGTSYELQARQDTMLLTSLNRILRTLRILSFGRSWSQFTTAYQDLDNLCASVVKRLMDVTWESFVRADKVNAITKMWTFTQSQLLSDDGWLQTLAYVGSKSLTGLAVALLTNRKKMFAHARIVFEDVLEEDGAFTPSSRGELDPMHSFDVRITQVLHILLRACKASHHHFAVFARLRFSGVPGIETVLRDLHIHGYHLINFCVDEGSCLKTLDFTSQQGNAIRVFINGKALAGIPDDEVGNRVAALLSQCWSGVSVGGGKPVYDASGHLVLLTKLCESWSLEWANVCGEIWSRIARDEHKTIAVALSQGIEHNLSDGEALLIAPSHGAIMSECEKLGSSLQLEICSQIIGWSPVLVSATEGFLDELKEFECTVARVLSQLQTTWFPRDAWIFPPRRCYPVFARLCSLGMQLKDYPLLAGLREARLTDARLKIGAAWVHATLRRASSDPPTNDFLTDSLNFCCEVMIAAVEPEFAVDVLQLAMECKKLHISESEDKRSTFSPKNGPMVSNRLDDDQLQSLDEAASSLLVSSSAELDETYTVAQLNRYDELLRASQRRRQIPLGREASLERKRSTRLENLQLRMERMLGEGAHGAVWLYSDVTTGTKYAVKHMSLKRDGLGAADQLLKEFSKEADNLKKLSTTLSMDVAEIACPLCPVNSHIVQYIGHEIHGNTLKLFMTFADSGTLLDLVTKTEGYDGYENRGFREQGGIGIKRVKLYARQILCALSKLHTSHLVHRDLSPNNILLHGISGGRDGEVKLTDFGSSTFMQTRQEHCEVKMTTGHRHGTAGFVCPLSMDNTSSYGCDIWALGCIVKYMLTGSGIKPRHLFNDMDVLCWLYRLNNCDACAVEELRGLINEVSHKDARDFIRICVEKYQEFNVHGKTLGLQEHRFITEAE